ncbi:MAG: DUF4058 family protein [Verrucomicrobia bacterium]|nr:DUF4058 family protein [Verrucomicrobiota bacterium]
MASPFPGMDPYLEGEMWQEFHGRLIHQISAQLIPLLAPKYVALLAKRYVLQGADLGIVGLDTSRVIYPDIHVVHAQEPDVLREGAGGGSVAEPAVELASPVMEEVPQLSVEIRDVAQRRLVTLIEILSPANKCGAGAQEYNQRRLEILRTQTHLLEIDLLRQGERLALQGKLPPASYYVFLSRTNRRPRTEVWPVALAHRLPTVPVPLLRPDPDVPLDLQAAVKGCFDLVGYERLLNYAPAPPPPPLSEPENLWLGECLQKAGVRVLSS